MTPMEMYADARRKSYTYLQMLESGAKNLAHMKGKRHD